MKYFSHTIKLLKEKLYEWYETAITMLPNIFVAVVVLVIFYFLGKFLKKISWRLLSKTTENPAIGRFLSQVIAFIIGTFGLIVILDIVNLDKTITSLLAGAGILGLAFSLAFQDTVANFVGSVFILTRKPFVIGNVIESNEIFGRVEKISMSATFVSVPEGQLVVIPNKKVMENVIRNYSFYGKRRVDIELRVELWEDVEKVMGIVRKTVEDSAPLLPDHPIDTFLDEFGDNSLNLVIRYWINFSTQADYLRRKSETMIAIQKAFADNNIRIPIPEHRIFLKDLHSLRDRTD